MGSDETKSALSRAFELVENGDYEEARAILDPILDADKNNADAWWIYAHAATDPDEGREALENVLRINPTYPGAAELIAIARERYEPPAEPEVPAVAPPPPAAPPSLPEAEFPELELAEPASAAASTQETPAVQAQSSRSNLVPLVAIAAVVVIVIILLILILPGGGGAETPTPTEVASVVELTPAEMLPVTEEATSESAAPLVTEMATEMATPEVLMTELVATEAPTRAPTITPTFTPEATEVVVAETMDASALNTALATFPLAADGVTQVETGLGQTMMANICAAPGREMRTLLPQVMNALAQDSPALDASVTAIGVHLVNCSDKSDLLTVATDRASAESYAAGSLSDSQFSALWQPQ